MDLRVDKVEGAIARLDSLVAAMLPRMSAGRKAAAERWRGDVGALRYHLRREPGKFPPVVVMIGGTGTGKSTIVNRILGQTISATSFRRTYTAGAVAIAASAANLPPQWLGVEQSVAAPTDIPARGTIGALLVAPLGTDLTRQFTLVDTPDLDGDQPAHHAEADRAFRWADALLFLVSPEKYQMTEALPYYRLAARYQVPAVFVMNKCEQQQVADDYEKLLKEQNATTAERKVFVVPRDDAGYEPSPEQNMAAMRAALLEMAVPQAGSRSLGLRNRSEDALGRLSDQIVAPLREDRREIDRLILMVRGMEAPIPGVDVNPLTQDLQRRMQQRSVLYLMGPQRILERVRQAPTMLIRLPRVAWDLVMRGNFSAASLNPSTGDADQRQVPDFATILKDQFAVLQSRLDDTLRSSPLVQRWTADGAPAPYKTALVDSAEAGKIATEELAELRRWLEQRWNATPRDTRILEAFLKYLPGGKQITKFTEAAPYLLVVVPLITHALSGGLDLVVIGSWSLVTWLSERISNEVIAHTRATNVKITERFTKLAHNQIERICKWLDEQAPTSKAIDQLEQATDGARQILAGER